MCYLKKIALGVAWSLGTMACFAQEAPAAAGGEAGARGAPTTAPHSTAKAESGGRHAEFRAAGMLGGAGGHGFAGPTLNYVTVSGKTEPAAYAGVLASPVGAAMAEQLKLQKGIGLMVDFVEPKSPAEAAEIKQYDILQMLDDQLLINAHQFAVLIRTHKAGDEVTLTVIHRGETRAVKMKLIEREVMALDAQNPWGVPTVPSPGSYGISSVVVRPPSAVGPVGAGGEGVAGPLGSTSTSEARLNDEDGSIVVQSGSGGRRVVVTKEGRVLGTYELKNDDKQLKVLPPEVKARYDRLMKMQERMPKPSVLPDASEPTAPGQVDQR